MKKIIAALLLILLAASVSPAQQKVTFSLGNRTYTGGILAYDVIATIPTGQFWAVGSSNIRVVAYPNPTTCLTAHPDNPAVGANANISGANGYQAMTTTAVNVSGGVGIGLNILTFNTSGFYRFNPGTYTLGKIRFNVTTPFNADTMKFRNPPLAVPITVVYDSTRKCAYGGTATDSARYNTINPIITGIIGENVLPKEFNLYQNYPNPFNPVTSIKYDVPQNSFVSIRVYDVTGKQIMDLVNGEQAAGVYEAVFDASHLASGVYFYRMEAGKFSSVMKMVLLK
jgi:hypothetical protein